MTKFKNDPPRAVEDDAQGSRVRTERLCASNKTPSCDPVLEKAWWKIDLAIVPVVSMFYLLAFLDRTNLANARVAGLQTDININNYQFSIALTVTYIPYILSQLPSNLILKAVGPNFLLPTMLVLWGVVTTLQGLVTSFAGLLICRFFLGLFEGGVFPGLVLYLSFWYPRQQLQQRVSAFFSTASLSGAFSGLLAYGIVRMDGIGNRPGWAWIFILEGIFTILFGVSTYITLPRSPAHARFLNKEEKDYINLHLRANDAAGRDESTDHYSWREVWETYTLPHVWMIGVVLFFGGANVYGLAYFTPTIIADLGYTAVNAQLFSVPPFAVAFVVAMITACISDRYGARGLVTIFAAILATIGFAMYLGSHSAHVKYGSLFFSITGAYIALPTLSTWMANNTAPHIRRATAVAFASTMSNFGGILVTWLFGTISPPPFFKTATITLLIFSVLTIVIVTATIAYFSLQNKKKAAMRLITSQDDESLGLGDGSAWFVYNL